MLTIILNVFLIIGFIVGWYQGNQELSNSKIRYPDKSMFKYWLN
jgi:hypothetical protein